MAQPLLCDAHKAPGVLLMNTLIPPVESLVFCEECLPAQVVLLFEQLGLAQEFADVVRAEERAKIQAEQAVPAQDAAPSDAKPSARKRVAANPAAAGEPGEVGK